MSDASPSDAVIAVLVAFIKIAFFVLMTTFIITHW